jgi:hypothetical protein
MPLLRSFGFRRFARYKDAAPLGLGKLIKSNPAKSNQKNQIQPNPTKSNQIQPKKPPTWGNKGNRGEHRGSSPLKVDQGGLSLIKPNQD